MDISIGFYTGLELAFKNGALAMHFLDAWKWRFLPKSRLWADVRAEQFFA